MAPTVDSSTLEQAVVTEGEGEGGEMCASSISREDANSVTGASSSTPREAPAADRNLPQVIDISPLLQTQVDSGISDQEVIGTGLTCTVTVTMLTVMCTVDHRRTGVIISTEATPTLTTTVITIPVLATSSHSSRGIGVESIETKTADLEERGENSSKKTIKNNLQIQIPGI